MQLSEEKLHARMFCLTPQVASRPDPPQASAPEHLVAMLAIAHKGRKPLVKACLEILELAAPTTVAAQRSS
jgi:hypothetical protein